MVADGLSIPREREPPAAEARGAGLARAFLAGRRENSRAQLESLEDGPVAVDQKVVREREDAVDVAFDVDVAVHVCLRHSQLAGRPEERAHCASMVEDESEACVVRLRRPDGAVPEADVEVARVVPGEEVTEDAEPGVGARRRARPGGGVAARDLRHTSPPGSAAIRCDLVLACRAMTARRSTGASRIRGHTRPSRAATCGTSPRRRARGPGRARLPAAVSRPAPSGRSAREGSRRLAPRTPPLRPLPGSSRSARDRNPGRRTPS